MRANMKKKLFGIILILFCISSIHSGEVSKKAVTYDLGYGRFGDKMLSYLHAKWVSYHNNIPLLFKPFPYSKELVMHYKEKRYSNKVLSRYSNIIYPSYQMTIDYRNSESALYVIPYFPECMWEHTPEENYYYLAVDWDDPGFRKELKKMIKPIQDHKPFIKLPKDRISVAVHVRRGGGFDTPDTAKKIPLKLPPDSYYIEQIQRIYDIFNGQPLYVYIFTDEKNPLEIVNNYSSIFADMDIKFDCRTSGNSHRSNVLQDFFEMTRFDCLIRPDSNYSIVASKIANYKVIISPVHAIKTDEMIYVDEIAVTYPPNL